MTPWNEYKSLSHTTRPSGPIPWCRETAKSVSCGMTRLLQVGVCDPPSIPYRQPNLIDQERSL